MKQREPFSEERIATFCLYCGDPPATREHVPSRVLLDKPYPADLPRVDACGPCNQGYSLDEEYLACLVECVISGTTDAAKLSRGKIQRLLRSKPALVARLEKSRTIKGDEITWDVETERVSRVIEKLARGHALYEFSDLLSNTSPTVAFAPLATVTPATRAAFERPVLASVWPEVGSRAFMAFAENFGAACHDWIVVQPGRYRYLGACAAEKR
jgi:hypothetical protein